MFWSVKIQNTVKTTRSDNRKILVDPVMWFGKEWTPEREITSKRHDLEFLNKVLLDGIVRFVSCTLMYHFTLNSLPLAYELLTALYITKQNPLTQVYYYKKRAVGNLLRPWNSMLMVDDDESAKFFTKKKRKALVVKTPFDGHWINKRTAKYLAGIEDMKLHWYDGYTSQLTQESPDTISMFFQGATYTGKLVGTDLQWSDGDLWVKDGLLFNGEWWLKKGCNGPSRKMAVIRGERILWTESNIEVPSTVWGCKIRCTAYGGIEGDDSISWSNGMQWEKTKRRRQTDKKTALQDSKEKS